MIFCMRVFSPFLNVFWSRLRQKLGVTSKPKPPLVRAQHLALDFLARVEGLFESGLDGMYGVISLRYGYRPAPVTGKAEATEQPTQTPTSSVADERDFAPTREVSTDSIPSPAVTRARSLSLNSFFTGRNRPGSSGTDVSIRKRTSSVS